MIGIGTEYEVVEKPLFWGGGRYMQMKAELHRKMLTGMTESHEKEKTANSKVFTKN